MSAWSLVAAVLNGRHPVGVVIAGGWGLTLLPVHARRRVARRRVVRRGREPQGPVDRPPLDQPSEATGLPD